MAEIDRHMIEFIAQTGIKCADMETMSKVPIVVVGGSAYADIDVLACVAAYKQFLQLQGFRADGLIIGSWNQTIPPSVKKWQIDVKNKFLYEGEKCDFVLVDFSDPTYVDSFVNLNEVIEVFDHHYGYEEYWRNKIGDKVKIEKIGACATLIWEEFRKAKIDHKISSINANLLYTAIFANTLDFKSAVTSKRDRVAAKELIPYTKLPLNWHGQYYAEIEKEFLKDAIKNIMEDTKKIKMFDTQFNFGQIELVDARNFLKKSINSFTDLELKSNEPWVVNIVSIEEGCSYLYSTCTKLLERLKTITAPKALEKPCNGGNILITPRVWLRKELLKELMFQEKGPCLH